MGLRRRIVLGIAALAVIVMGSTTQSTAASSRKTTGARRPSLAIQFQKGRYLLAEPLTLVLTLRNGGPAPVEHLVAPDAPKCQQIDVVGRNGKTTTIDNPQALFPPGRPDEITVEGGGAVTARVVLDVTLADIFPKVGKYKVRLRVHCEGDKRPALQSNWVAVEVVAPTGPDADALRALQAEGDPFAVMNSLTATPSRDLARRLERFASDHSGSTYAAYVRLSLATFYETFEKNPGKARATLSELARSENVAVSEMAAERLRSTGQVRGVTQR
jgi:hypothetical protein